MLKDNNGQAALEYILIFAVSLLLLIVFTLPLVNQSVENTLDVSDTLEVKSDLSEISHAVSEVYGQGQGSKQKITITSQKNFKVNINNNYISSNLKLNDGSYKNIKVDVKSNLDKSSVSIQEGVNTIIVEWPQDGENMQIYTKLF